MIYHNRTHLLDILCAASATLIQTGEAYPQGSETPFKGVKRPNNGVDVATAMYVNVFDESYEKAGSDHRPAIYLGGPGNPVVDDLERRGIAAVPFEWRALWLPLVLVCQAPTKHAAERMRDQLRGNVRSILMNRANFAQNGYWYALTIPGRKGGGAAAERSTASDGGAGASGGTRPPNPNAPAMIGVAEAQCIIPVKICYSYQATSPA